jgi:4-hydroxy-3-methylbut-2-enyl diphosphate reductase
VTEAVVAPDGPITVGVTSGASTPDRAVEAAIERIFQLKAETGLVTVG